MKGNIEKEDPLWKEYLDKAAVYDERMPVVDASELNKIASKIVDVLVDYVGYFFATFTINANSTIVEFHWGSTFKA